MLWCHLEAYRLQIHICMRTLISPRPTMRCTQLLALAALSKRLVKTQQHFCLLCVPNMVLNVTSEGVCVCVHTVYAHESCRGENVGRGGTLQNNEAPLQYFPQHWRENPHPDLGLALTRISYHRFMTKTNNQSHSYLCHLLL